MDQQMADTKEDSRTPGINPNPYPVNATRTIVPEPSLGWPYPVSISPGLPRPVTVTVQEEGGSQSPGIRRQQEEGSFVPVCCFLGTSCA